jgi:drug/metabolite transporter (DMT)-like permease
MGQPVATLMLAAAILDERPSGLQLLGTGLVLLGILVAGVARSSGIPGGAARTRIELASSRMPRGA